MRLGLFIVFTCFSFLTLLAQTEVEIEGRVFSQEDHLPLEAASIYALNKADSSLVAYSISDEKGQFSLAKKTRAKTLELYVSFIGYKTFRKTLNAENAPFQLGEINLSESGLLDEVELAIAPPVSIKKDTIEFNAESFKTKKDATVEDLLKKLPGVKITKDGKIMVNGKEVKDIKVNGKSFFGSDPSIALKNLTKDMIEKVQISDSKTKDQAFTGEESDGETKSINLTIKEDKNKGVFGRLKAGAGNDGRYQFSGMLNRFNNERQISVLVGGNNINQPGFGFDELNKMFSSSLMWGDDGVYNQVMNGGDGINTTRNYGVAFNDKLWKKVDVSLNYFGSRTERETRKKQRTLTALSDTSSIESEFVFDQTTESDKHQLSAEFEYKIDTTWQFTYTPGFSFSKSEAQWSNNSFTNTADQDSVNYSQANNFESKKQINFTNDFVIVRNVGDRGSFLRLGLWQGLTKNEDHGNVYSKLTTTENNLKTEQLQDQKPDSETSKELYGYHLKYRHNLIPKKLFWDSGFRFENTATTFEKNTFDRDQTTGNYTTLNNALSGDFKYTITDYKPYTGIRYKTKKLTANASLDLINRTQTLKDQLRPDQNTERTDNFLNLTSWFRYKISRNKSIYGSFRNRNTSPQLSQIQTNPMNSDPQNIIVGNPNLKSISERRYYINFNNYSYKDQTGMYIYMHGSFTDDQIVRNTIVDPVSLVRNTTFNNLSGNYRHTLGITQSKDNELDSLLTFESELEFRTTYSKNSGFINGDVFTAYSWNINPSAQIGLDYLDKYYIGLSYEIDFDRTEYSSKVFDLQKNTLHEIGFESEINFTDRLRWENDLVYTYNSNVGDGFKKDFWMWNSSVVYEVMPDKLEFSLRAYDLLNQNTNTRRNIFGNVIQDTESLVLKRYFMFSLSWKFNTLGAKGESNDHNYYYRG